MTRNGNAPVIEIPDVLGVQGRAQQVANLLGSIQAQIFELEPLMVVNGHTDDDRVAGGVDGLTYAQKRDKLKKAIEKLAEAFPEEMALLGG